MKIKKERLCGCKTENTNHCTNLLRHHVEYSSDIEAKRLGNSVKGPETTHTPTPWKIEYREHGFTRRPVICSGYETIADRLTPENAALIVRTVNSHEAKERAIRNVFLRLKRVFDIEMEFKPEVRILLAEALMFADEGMERC